MDIVIHLERLEPPAGKMVLTEHEPRQRAFEGWLAMVVALYELLGTDGSTGNGAPTS